MRKRTQASLVSTTKGLVTPPFVVTDWFGMVTTTLRADTVPGIATVTASGLGTSGSTDVRFKGFTLDVSATPSELPADGHTAGLVTARAPGRPRRGRRWQECHDSHDARQGEEDTDRQRGFGADGHDELVGRGDGDSLTPTDVGTATITATYGVDVSAQTPVDFVGFTLEYWTRRADT